MEIVALVLGAMLVVLLLAMYPFGASKYTEGWNDAWRVYTAGQLPQRSDLRALAVFKLNGYSVASFLERSSKKNWLLGLADVPRDDWPEAGKVYQAFEATKGVYEIRLSPTPAEDFDQYRAEQESKTI